MQLQILRVLLLCGIIGLKTACANVMVGDLLLSCSHFCHYLPCAVDEVVCSSVSVGFVNCIFPQRSP